MAKIEFSPAFAAGLPQRLVGLNSNAVGTGSPSGVGLLGGWDYDNRVYLLIFKGVRLTKSEIISSRNLGTSGTPLRNSITNNLLINYNNEGTGGWSHNFKLSVLDNEKVIVNTEFVAASASGSATWFSLFHVPGHLTSGRIGNFITGDIGITGSGADIEIPDTNITTGELYRILGWKLKFPSSWTY